jgi:hypothetical protein
MKYISVNMQIGRVMVISKDMVLGDVEGMKSEVDFGL